MNTVFLVNFTDFEGKHRTLGVASTPESAVNFIYLMLVADLVEFFDSGNNSTEDSNKEVLLRDDIVSHLEKNRGGRFCFRNKFNKHTEGMFVIEELIIDQLS